MDAYSSLLNLNFMASLRTGNLIVDMFIAMLIPFISGLVAYLCQRLWPETVQWFVDQFKVNGNRMYITQSIKNNENSSLNINENMILREAILNYVAHELKPMYAYGNYEFQRLPIEGGISGRSAAEVIEQMYHIRTVPKIGKAVDVAPGVRMTIEENTDDNSKENDNNNNNNKGGAVQRLQSLGSNRKGITDHNVVLESLERGLYFNDAPLEFARAAFNWYRKQIHSDHDKNRYLYIPMLQSNGLLGGEGIGSEEDRHVIKCQRYLLSLDKTFSSLFFPQKEKLIELITSFESRTGKFAIPGFPHRLVLLLYGPPGTGKTSLVKAIAAYTHRHILSIDLSRVQTNRQLINYLYDGRVKIVNYVDPENPWREKTQTLHAKRVVYMLEDVDAASSLVMRKNDDGEPMPNNSTITNTAKANITVSKENKKEDVEAGDGGHDDGGDYDHENKGEEISDTTDIIDDEDQKQEGKENDKDNNSVKTIYEEYEKGQNRLNQTKTSEGTSNVVAVDHDNKDESEHECTSEKDVLVDRVTIKDSNRPRFLEANDKLSIKGILDAMGGILESPGRIIIMTTNHIEHLDPALLRPGVVTMKLHMNTFTPACALEMVEHYFANMKPLSASTLESIRQTISAANSESDGKHNNVKGFSPAEVEQMCAESESIEDLLQLLQRGSRTEVY